MAAPIVRDLALRLPRSGAAGSELPADEARFTCWTGRDADDTAAVIFAVRQVLPAPEGPTLGEPASGEVTSVAGFHTIVCRGLVPGGRYQYELIAQDRAEPSDQTRVGPDRFTQPPAETATQ